MSDPLISVILPTRNRAHVLGESVESVLGQTYDRFELIVVDDASTDETSHLAHRYKDERIRWIRLSDVRGAGGARNAGLDEARGDWIAFQDSDDTWMPEKLRKQVDCAQSLPASYVGVYTSYWKEMGGKRILLPLPGRGRDDDVLSGLPRGNFITIQTLMVRGHGVGRVERFDETLTAMADWDYAIRVAQHGPVKWLPEPLVVYRLQPDSNSLILDRFENSYRAIMEKHRSLMMQNRENEAWHWATIGNRLCREGLRQRGREYLYRAWGLCPRDHRYAGAWLMSWFPTPVFRGLARMYASIRS